MKRYRFLRFPEGKAKAVTLSYDDGVREDIRLSDIITPHGMKCTFNYNSPIMRENLSEEEVAEYVIGRGHEIAVHGEYHKANGSHRPIEGIIDVLNCRLALEKKYKRIIRGMAYPDSGITLLCNGTDYESIKQYLKELDITYSRTLGGDNNSFELPQDFYAWMPTAHHNNPKIFEYIDEFLSIDTSEKAYCARREPRLFYLWGHSYEFENNNNWDLLEKISKKLGDRDDIWYATNGEIYDYVNAYNSLVFSADGNIIYNPTLYKIWFDIDCRMYTIEPGQTLEIKE